MWVFLATVAGVFGIATWFAAVIACGLCALDLDDKRSTPRRILFAVMAVFLFSLGPAFEAVTRVK